MIKKWLIVLAIPMLLSASLAFADESDNADKQPDATLTFSEWEYGLLLSGNNGHGVLSFGDHDYVFHAVGGKLGGLGVTHADASGKVFGLENVEDFSGTYFTAEAGATGGVGRTGTWLKNSNGVSIHLTDKSKGLALSVGAGGIKIYFADKSEADE
jgi:hypothetical protein